MTTSQPGRPAKTQSKSAHPAAAGARRSSFAAIVAAAALLGLSACGGGGGDGGGAAEAAAVPGVVAVTVHDSYGTAVAGARISGPRGETITNALGVSLVGTDAPGATTNVTVSRDAFVDRSVALASTAGRVNEVTITLDRATSAAGGSLSSRSGVLPTIDSSGQEMSFEIELVVVDGASKPIESLSRASFALRPCTPDPANAVVDCVRGAVAGDDVAFTPVASAPETLALVPGGASRPFATALLLDQSGSIAQTDPGNARLYSAKAFLGGLGAQDRVVLAAFAGAPGALLPSAPLTVYGPFREQTQATSYYATLDTLGPLVGGNTPLYDSIDMVREQWLGAATPQDQLGKSLVVFTDGADTGCAGQAACRTRREQTILGARQSQVRIFAIGLSGGADLVALGELANQTGGALLYADNAAQLVPLYGSVGQLMSLSLATYRLRWTVRSEAPGGFRAGQALLGRVQVSTAGSTFDVPFVVGMP
jgi:von Willebrand factor type A domain